MKKLKQTIMSFFLCLAAVPLFAQGGLMPAGMKNLADNIYEIMTGDFVRVLLACFLAGAAVTFAFNKDNEKIKKNAIAVAVAAAILMTASGVVEAVMSAARG